MDKPLLSVAPADMHEDEQRIGAGYRRSLMLVVGGAVPIVATAYFFDLKWVLVVGLVVVINAINNTEARLYDLCIRLRRTNALLSDRNSKL